MVAGYWPWWLGGIALAGVAVLSLLLVRRPFGVSGSFANVLDAGARRREDALLGQMAKDAELERAMMAATAAEFGPDAVPPVTTDNVPLAPPRMTWNAELTFIVAIAFGGLLGAVSSGNFGAMDFGPTFARLFGDGPLAWVMLVVGGVLVGFGTQMAGGCTSGHGLNGCARLEKGSLLATASFFGTGILVSLLIEGLR